MTEVVKYIGLDVHKQSIAVGVATGNAGVRCATSAQLLTKTMRSWKASGELNPACSRLNAGNAFNDNPD